MRRAARGAYPPFPDLPHGEVCVEPPTGCNRCGAELTGRRTRWCSDACRNWWYSNHRWTDAREESMRRSARACVRCAEPATEVDHIIPRRGEPIHTHSCKHHQANLRPLCRSCHLTRNTWDSPSSIED